MLALPLCDRRVSLWTLLVFLAITYTISSLWYVGSYVSHPSGLLRHNSSWWKVTGEPYNMSLLNTTDDFSRLVNIDRFRYLINNRRCDGDDHLFLIVFVHSAPSNFRKRQAIRETWGNEKNLEHDPMRVVFLVGTVEHTDVQEGIEQENAFHHDIIQGNFVDSYRNLTYKHVMGLKWVTYFCRQARFIFKTDDDIFVDVFQLVAYLKDTFGRYKVGNLMMCYLIKSPYVKRSQRSKWRVSFKEYPGRYYPTYCSGWGIIMSPDVVFRLYLLSSKVPYFWVDDVHISGTLASKVGITHLDFTEKLALTAIDINKWLNSKEVMRPYLFGHPDSDADTIFALWNRTMQYYGQPIEMFR